MQRKYTKPSNSKKSRLKTAGEIIIENMKEDGVEVNGEELCRHDDCPYCENCPMNLAFYLEKMHAYYEQCEIMVRMESNGCPLATVLIDEILDPTQNSPEELARHEFAFGLAVLGLGNEEGLDWIEKAANDGNKEAKQFLKTLKQKK